MENINKQPPKGKIKFSITLSEEQKMQRQTSRSSIYLVRVAGSGKTPYKYKSLDMFFTLKINQIIITRPTVSNEDNGYSGSLDEKMEFG